ncbi:hypothetical protein RHSIM_Rhsim05G0227100 [Rhododendron simsii]|uniref:Uncharacterized protein n=1 Tax=Rhododendron simsii TaxID=118357 RepID=A0A834LPU9_RHOSS|nr:hypothetical protein RHSIM_Rhsim05G0227100 [Rhododendron simsii]
MKNLGCKKRNSSGNHIMRRRSKKREAESNSLFNVAEARREGKNTSNYDGNIGETISTLGSSQCHHYCYSVLDSLPLPQPTWSTTAPSIITISTLPPPPPQPPPATHEFSYCWWMGFLNSNLEQGNNLMGNYNTMGFRGNPISATLIGMQI